MKIALCALLPLLSLSATVVCAEIKPGDSPAEVRAALGVPRGQTALAGREILYYDRGQVEIRAGVVTRVSLRSDAEQADFEARRAAEAIRVRDEQDIRRAKLTVEGEKLKALKLADASFQNLPLSYQVAFWQDFSRSYPDVASAEVLSEARLKLATEMEETRRNEDLAARLAVLEERVAGEETAVSLVAESSNRFYPRNYYYHDSSFRDYERKQPSLRYETHLYEYPLPYATSPGMPPRQPVYRKDPTPVYMNPQNNPNASGEDNSRGSDDDSSNYRRQRSNSRRF